MICCMGIILIGGLKHCGKSTLGRIIAGDLDYRFYDMDNLVLKETGGAWTSVRSIWQDLGKDEFMLLEEDAARNFIEWVVPDLDGRDAGDRPVPAGIYLVSVESAGIRRVTRLTLVR